MSISIPFNRPTTSSGARAALDEVIASGRLSGNGPFTQRSEQHLQQLMGASRVLLTSSCTSALEIAAVLLDAAPGDEVIVPSFTFVSTANAFLMRGLRPVFADCRADTFNIDERVLPGLIGPRTRAIVVMHYGGVACEMGPILELATAHGLMVIEDNAHGLFASYGDKPLGTFGALATQSFHETKNVTCGEGGALIVNDPALAGRAELIREKGTNRSRFFRGETDRYTWVDLGSNYLASELQAALLASQLDEWPTIQKKRRAIWDRYNGELAEWAGANDVQLPVVPPGCHHSSHAFYMLMPTAAERTRVITDLKASGISVAFHYLPLHISPVGISLGGTLGDCPVTEDISDRLIRLPFYTDLSFSDQTIVIDALRSLTLVHGEGARVSVTS